MTSQRKAPWLVLTFPSVPITIRYHYVNDKWIVEHDDETVRRAYLDAFQTALESSATMFRQYSAHPRLDVLQELSETWGFRITGLSELRSWLGTQYNNDRIY